MHLEEALDGVEIVVLAIPSSVILNVVDDIIPYLRPGHVLLDLAKGLAPGKRLISQATRRFGMQIVPTHWPFLQDRPLHLKLLAVL